MKKTVLIVFAGALVCLLAVTASLPTRAVRSGNATTTLAATLTGFQEPPALASPAHGDFFATVSADGTSIEYTLSYADFGTDVLFSHIHLGLPSVNGGVAIFLCGGDGKPACPAREGSVSGTITEGNVRAITAQRLAAGDLATMLEAMDNGATYVNVHSTALPGGEIRGQVQVIRQ